MNSVEITKLAKLSFLSALARCVLFLEFSTIQLERRGKDNIFPPSVCHWFRYSVYSSEYGVVVKSTLSTIYLSDNM